MSSEHPVSKPFTCTFARTASECVAPGTLHAFRNSGTGFVEVVSLSNGHFDPAETHYETLLT